MYILQDRDTFGFRSVIYENVYGNEGSLVLDWGNHT